MMRIPTFFGSIVVLIAAFACTLGVYALKSAAVSQVSTNGATGADFEACFTVSSLNFATVSSGVVSARLQISRSSPVAWTECYGMVSQGDFANPYVDPANCKVENPTSNMVSTPSNMESNIQVGDRIYAVFMCTTKDTGITTFAPSDTIEIELQQFEASTGNPIMFSTTVIPHPPTGAYAIPATSRFLVRSLESSSMHLNGFGGSTQVNYEADGVQLRADLLPAGVAAPQLAIAYTNSLLADAARTTELPIEIPTFFRQGERSCGASKGVACAVAASGCSPISPAQIEHCYIADSVEPVETDSVACIHVPKTETTSYLTCETSVAFTQINSFAPPLDTDMIDFQFSFSADVGASSFPEGQVILTLTFPPSCGYTPNVPVCSSPPTREACSLPDSAAGEVALHLPIGRGTVSTTASVPLAVGSNVPPEWSLRWSLTSNDVPYAEQGTLSFPLEAEGNLRGIMSSSHSFINLSPEAYPSFGSGESGPETSGTRVEVLYSFQNTSPSSSRFATQSVVEPAAPTIDSNWEIDFVTAEFPPLADGEVDPAWNCRSFTIIPNRSLWPFANYSYGHPREPGLLSSRLPIPVSVNDIHSLFVSCYSPLKDITKVLPKVRVTNTLGFGATLPETDNDMTYGPAPFVHVDTLRYTLSGPLSNVVDTVLSLLPSEAMFGVTNVTVVPSDPSASQGVFQFGVGYVSSFLFASVVAQSAKIHLLAILHPFVNFAAIDESSADYVFYSAPAGEYFFNGPSAGALAPSKTCGAVADVKCMVLLNEQQNTVPCIFATPITENSDAGCKPEFVCSDPCEQVPLATIGYLTASLNVTANAASFFVPREYSFKLTLPETFANSYLEHRSGMVITASDGVYSPTITVNGTVFYVALGAVAADPLSKYIYSELGLSSSTVAPPSFNFLFDIVDTVTGESYLHGGERSLAMDQGFNYFDSRPYVLSDVTRSGGLLSIYARIENEWGIVRSGLPFRVDGPDGTALEGCNGFLECSPDNANPFIAPFLGEPATQKGFTSLNTPRGFHAQCGFANAIIVTCPSSLPEGSLVTLSVVRELPSMKSGAKPAAGRAGAPVTAHTRAQAVAAASVVADSEEMQTLAYDNNDGPEPLPVILATVAVPADAPALNDGYCHRGHFDLTFRPMHYAPASSGFATLDTSSGNEEEEEEEEDEEVTFYTPELIERTTQMVQSAFSHVGDWSSLFYSMSPEGSVVVRGCSQFYESSSINWNMAHNHVFNLYLGASEKAANITSSIIARGYNTNVYAPSIGVSGSPAAAQPYLTAPSEQVDFMCAPVDADGAPVDGAEPSRAACTLQKCSHSLASPIKCHFGLTETTPQDECYFDRFNPEKTLKVHGCNFNVIDVAFQAAVFGSNNITYVFEIIPEFPEQFAMAPNVSLMVNLPAGTPEFSSLNDVTITRSAKEDNFDTLKADAYPLFMGNFFLVHIFSNFTDRYTITFPQNRNEDLAALYSGVIRGSRAVYYDYKDSTSPLIFNSTSAFSTVALSATAAGGDLLYLAPSAGSLAHAPAMAAIVAISGAETGFACSAAAVPSTSDAHPAHIFPAAWPTPVPAATVLDVAGDVRVSMSFDGPAIASLVGLGVRCEGAWKDNKIPSQTVFMGFLSGSDGLFYGGHVATVEAVDVSDHNHYMSIEPVVDGTTTATAAAAVQALIPEWLATTVLITTVSVSPTAPESLVMRFNKGSQMYLPSSASVFLGTLANTASLVPSDAAAVEAAQSSLALLMSRPAGEWGCDTEDDETFSGKCAPANACSDVYSAPRACVASFGIDTDDTLLAHISCAFAPQLPALPEYSGCGEFKCMSDNGDIIDCADSSACVAGCAANVPLTPELAATVPALTPVCVKGGIVSPAATFCPTAGVPAPVFASVCNATSACAAVCAGADGNVVECSSAAAWGQCSQTCGAGKQTIEFRCGDSAVSVGETAPAAAPEDFCGDWTAGPGFVTERDCTGTMCPVAVTVVEGPGADEYTIEWFLPSSIDGNTPAAISLLIDGPASAGGGLSTALGTVPAGDLAMTFDAVARSVRPGNYTAQVLPEGGAAGHSDPFTVAIACERDGACVNGECVAATGVCECKGEWSGRACTVPPCETKGCGSATTESCAHDDDGIATCTCQATYAGDKCETPLQCSEAMPACAHDGSRPGEVFANGTVACQDCVCKGHWDPAYDCSECGLVCFNKGFRDDDCTFCTCPVGGGYHGSNCHCRHAYMSFVVLAEKLPFTAAGAVSADERANLLASFSSTFASELRTAVGAAKVAAEAHIEEQTSPKGKRHFIFSFRVGPECPAVPAASASGAVVDTEMLSTYAGITLLKRSLSNNNHLATSALSLMNPTAGFGAHDPNCRLPGDECPTGWRKNGVYVDEEGTGGGDEPGSHETKPGSDGLSTGAIVGIAVGGSIFLFILIGVIASACLGLLCFAGKKSRMDQNST